MIEFEIIDDVNIFVIIVVNRLIGLRVVIKCTLDNITVFYDKLSGNVCRFNY